VHHHVQQSKGKTISATQTTLAYASNTGDMLALLMMLRVLLKPQNILGCMVLRRLPKRHPVL
jgi:hypothetical protein